ncbi:hypothetical protein WJX74_000942 [Apatococcus lobatus]|uniref:Uncharacterized protein n=1 Tax=Apatococcus lobatus TaxID=904363 RepID=A0AAW1SFV4_9CHLO
MSRLAKALAEYEEETAKRKRGLDAEYQSWEEKLRLAKQTLETQKQTALDEQNKVAAASAQISKLQQEVACVEAEAVEIDQAANLATAETKILETAEQKIFTKLRDAVAYLRQSEMETEKLLAEVKVVCMPLQQDQAMHSAGTHDIDGNMDLGPSTWMSLRMPQQAHPAECSAAGAIVPCMSNQQLGTPLAASQAANSLSSPADVAAMLEDTQPQALSLPSVSRSEAEALGAGGNFAQPLLHDASLSQLGYSGSPQLALSGDGGSNQTMQIPMLAGESSPAGPGSARSAPGVQAFSSLLLPQHTTRARAQAQQPGQLPSFMHPTSRLRPGHTPGRAPSAPTTSQPAALSFFPADSPFNSNAVEQYGLRGPGMASSSHMALPNGDGPHPLLPMSMGGGFSNDPLQTLVLSPRQQSPFMQQHPPQMNGHMQPHQSPHRVQSKVRSPTTSQPQSYILNGHIQQPPTQIQPQHGQQQGPQHQQPGAQQGVVHQAGSLLPVQQSQQQQGMTGAQRPQPMQQQPQRPQPIQQQPQQRPQPIQQQQPVLQNGGPEAAAMGTPPPHQQQQGQPQQVSRAASSDSQHPAGPSPGSRPASLRVVIPRAGRNRSEGQAPADVRPQPNSASSEPSSTTQTQSGSAKLGASGPQPMTRTKKKRKTHT